MKVNMSLYQFIRFSLYFIKMMTLHYHSLPLKLNIGPQIKTTSYRLKYILHLRKKHLCYVLTEGRG